MPMLKIFRTRPKIALPPNFLRTAFQVGTSLYKTDALPSGKMGVITAISEMIEEVHPCLAEQIESLKSPKEFKAGYFCNSRGGFIAYCHYDSPTLFNFNRKSSAFVIGKLGNGFVTHTYLSFIGIQDRMGLIPREMSIAYDSNSRDGQILFQKVDVGNQIDIMQAFGCANQCFLKVLTNQPINPKEINKDVTSLNYGQLKESFQGLQNRVMVTLEKEVQISESVPLNRYYSDPIIQI